MKYRFLGETLQLVKYLVIVTDDNITYEFTAVTNSERDGLLERYPAAEFTEIDNSGYEWLDGTIWTAEQLRNGELAEAIEMGQEAYEEMKNAPSQDEINAMLMLEIAQLKAGVINE